MNELTTATSEKLIAKTKTSGANYIVTSPLTGAEEKLIRDVDFGVIPGTKKPSLLKSGAEKIVGAYQLMTRYDIVSSIEQNDGKNAFFMYTVKCSLVKGFMDGQGKYAETVYATAFGSSNTSERRNGMNAACDAANATLKMAQKRALTTAALAISGLSSMFTMDIEDEATAKAAAAFVEAKPDSPITKSQQNRIFGIAGKYGLTREECKNELKAMGYDKTSAILQKDYDAIVEKLKNIDAKEKDNGD